MGKLDYQQHEIVIMNNNLFTFFALMLMPVFAHAHSGGEYLHGFIAGFSHPFSGIDHIIAMVAVGVWAKQRGGNSLFLLPFSFVVLMTLAALIGMSGIAVAGTETGIMVSNAALIALLLISSRLSTAVSIVIVGFFALFHGISHGVEMPLAIESLSYMIGFIMATSLLHGAGLLGASLWKRQVLWNDFAEKSL
jgi:urease accessory protein